MSDLTRIVSSQPIELTDGISQTAVLITTSPVGTEAALVVRNIPSGTTTVAGTVTASPTGTYTVAGTVTSVSSGTTTVVGNAASGSAVAGNPVLVGGSDGANARTMLIDTSGRHIAVGAAAAASAVTGNPVLVGGSDGTNAQVVSVTAKGTQGALGLTTQNLKDSGRVAVSINYTSTAPPTTDTMVTLIPVRTITAGGGVSTGISVTAGKTLRITSIFLDVRTTTAAQCYARATLRIGTTPLTTASTPIAYLVASGSAGAVTNEAGFASVNIPDGYEISGTTVLGVSIVGNVATNVVDLTILGFEY